MRSASVERFTTRRSSEPTFLGTKSPCGSDRGDTVGTKLAVAGKGGVGKTTIVGSLARIWAQDGMRVLAVDADPAAHLHAVLEVPKSEMPNPISSELDLIEERTGARPGTTTGPFFRLNPKVDDIPAKYSRAGADGVRLLVLGTIKAAGSGCFCPENAILRSLLEHLVLDDRDAVVVDMEAGLEPFGRATCRGVDMLLVVVEPGSRSIETGARLSDLGRQMGVRRVGIVANRVRDERQREAVEDLLASHRLTLLDVLPEFPSLATADLEGRSPFALPEAGPWIQTIRGLSSRISSEIAHDSE